MTDGRLRSALGASRCGSLEDAHQQSRQEAVHEDGRFWKTACAFLTRGTHGFDFADAGRRAVARRSRRARGVAEAQANSPGERAGAGCPVGNRTIQGRQIGRWPWRRLRAQVRVRQRRRLRRDGYALRELLAAGRRGGRHTARDHPVRADAEWRDPDHRRRLSRDPSPPGMPHTQFRRRSMRLRRS